MFLNNAIHQYCKEQGIHPHSKSSSDLIRSGMVSAPLHHPQSKTIIMLVEDHFQIAIRYKNAFLLDYVHCSCQEKKPCEHTFAALYYLLELEDADLIETKTLPTGIQGMEENETLPGFETTPLNEFRIVPAKDLSDYLDYLNLYKPPFVRNFAAIAFEKIILKAQNKIEVVISEEHYFQEDKPALLHKVEIVSEQGDFKMRCQSCHEKSYAMCLHQYEALKNQDVKSMFLSGQMPDYNTETEYWAKKYGVTQGKFSALYEIVIERQHTKAELVNLQYFSAQKLAGLKREIESEILGNPILVSGIKNEEEGNYGNALLWNVWGEEDIVQLIKGKLDKEGSEFHTKIERTEYPEYLPGFEKDLWYKIERFCKENKEDQVSIKSLSWNRFLQHISGEINYLNHYITTGSREPVILSKRQLKRIVFSPDFADAIIKVTKEEGFFKARILFSVQDLIIDPDEFSILMAPYFIIIQDIVYIFKHPELGRLFSVLGRNEILVDSEQVSVFQNLLYTLNNIVEIDYPEELEPSFLTLENPHWKIQIKEKGNYLIFTPILEYPDVLEISLPLEKWIFSKPDSDILYTILEEDVDKFNQFFMESHEQLKANLFSHGNFFLHYKDYLHENWFLHFFEICREKGISISGQDELENFRMNTYKPTIRMGISSGIDWFDIEVNIQYGNQQVSSREWLDAMKKNEKYILLKDGSLGMIPDEWYHKLKRLSLVSFEEKGKIKLNLYHFNLVESLFDEIEDEELHRQIKSRISVLGEYDFAKIHPLPTNVKVELRDYQKLGFQWLKSLSELRFGGCLADDMGLGKTLQVLTLLADQKILGQKTSLIVVPRSLLFNWAKEIEKFYPDFTYMYYHGIDRVQTRSKIFSHDIVISTYDTVTNDIEFLKDHNFNYVILDESQAIKNPESKRYKAMRLLRSDNRIVLTGTPIENNTFDLYAQFSFVNPGIFGSAAQFKNNFAIPIDRENDKDTGHMLRKLIHPFLLRRTKAQVAADLPERSENILYCEMGETQRAMYEEFKAKIKFEIDEGVKNVGLNKMRIKVIEGLLRLRQICNSPRLLGENLPNHLRQSVKIETLIDIIENDMGDHHALVYSQFTSMLALIREELDARNIPYAYLDGSTRDREGAVNYFMQNKEVKLFLISLKAGNTGLNLVKADYVYIMDPWWNPAVEAQAIDRTHRIGQDKNVFAYKMICRNTIEEKIVVLQEKKKQLATDLIITDEQVFKSLNNEDLMSLFN